MIPPVSSQMNPELTDLLAKAKTLVDSWTPEQREEHFRLQRESMARSYREAPESETRVVVVSGGTEARNAAVRASQPDYRGILLALIRALVLCEGRGDVMEDAWQALKLAGMEPPEDTADNDIDLHDWLKAQGVKSLWGAFPPVGNS